MQMAICVELYSVCSPQSHLLQQRGRSHHRWRLLQKIQDIVVSRVASGDRSGDGRRGVVE